MKLKLLIAIGGTLAACGKSEFANDYDQPVNTAEKEVQSGEAQKAGGDECSSSGEFGIHITGMNLSQYNGAKVVTSAFANPERGNGSRVVLKSGRIYNGGFSLDCDKSLTTNYGYPSWAVYVDVDRNGKCSAADIGVQMQLYGWNSEVKEEISNDAWKSVSSADKSGSLLGPPLGSAAKNFCAGYFGN